MFNRQLVQLMKINLLYVNPQLTRRQRENGKTGSALYRSLIRQYVLLGVIFTALYGGSMLLVNLSKNVAVFTNLVALFTVIGLAQSITAIDNVFLESKDLADYLPLPLNPWSIYIAKFSVVGLTVLPVILPVWIMFVIAGLVPGRFIGVGITVGTLLFLLYYIFLFVLCSVGIFSFSQTKLYRRHQKMMTFLMTALSMIAMVVAILVMNMSEDNKVHTAVIPGLSQLHQVIVSPLSLESLITVAVLILATAVLGVILQKRLLPKILSGANTQEIRTVKRKHRPNQGMARQFIRYNLGLLGNPTLSMQSISQTIFPIGFFAIIMVFQNGLSLRGLTVRDAGVTFLAGIMIAVMTINQASLSGVFISLERQNLGFIKSLPIDFKGYLWLKFRIVTAIQAVILLVIVVGVGVLTKLVWIDILTLAIGALVGNWLSSLYNFTRDWRLLDLTWTNATQLFNRGGGNMANGFVLLGGIIIGVLLVSGYAALVTAYSPIVVNAVAIVLMMMAGTAVLMHYYRYWKSIKLTL